MDDTTKITPADQPQAKVRKLEVKKQTVRRLTDAEVMTVSGGCDGNKYGTITNIDSCGCSFGCSIGC